MNKTNKKTNSILLLGTDMHMQNLTCLLCLVIPPKPWLNNHRQVDGYSKVLTDPLRNKCCYSDGSEYGQVEDDSLSDRNCANLLVFMGQSL